VDSGYSLDACDAFERGRGLPSAAGRYTVARVHLGAALGIDY
jgi:hypothetical protein